MTSHILALLARLFLNVDGLLWVLYLLSEMLPI